MFRYYSTQRPVCTGTYPKKNGCGIYNYPTKQEVPEIGCEAWGYIDYPEPLTEQEAEDFELLDGRIKTWYGVVTTVYNDGRLVSKLIDKKQAVLQPESTSSSTSRRDIYIDWFGSLEEAVEFVESSKMA